MNVNYKNAKKDYEYFQTNDEILTFLFFSYFFKLKVFCVTFVY